MKRVFLPLCVAALLLVVVPVMAQDDIPATSAVTLATNTPIAVVEDVPAADPPVYDIPAPLPDPVLTDWAVWFEGAVLAILGPFATSTIAVVVTSFLMGILRLPDTNRKSISLAVGAVLYVLALLFAHFGLRDQFNAVLNSLIVILPALTTLIGTFVFQPTISQQFANAAAKYAYINLNAQARASAQATAMRAASVPDLSQYVRREDIREEMTRFLTEVKRVVRDELAASSIPASG